MDIFIYILKHPQSNEVRYVGKTNDLKNRMFNHIANSKSGRKSHLYSWIKSLREMGLLPVIEVIETCNETNWTEREIYWIREYKNNAADLCNMTDGGETGMGGYVDVEDKLKKVQAAIKLIKAGTTQTHAESVNGLYKGFLSQLRRKHIPYLKNFKEHIPTATNKNYIKILNSHRGSGYAGIMKNKGKGYTYSKQLNRWLVRGYKNEKRTLIGYFKTEEEAILCRVNYLESI